MAFLFSQHVEPCGANDAGAIGAAIEIDGALKRPPIAVARIVEKLADGAVARMTADEVSSLATLDIAVIRQSDGRYRSETPIKVAMYFRAIAK